MALACEVCWGFPLVCKILFKTDILGAYFFTRSFDNYLRLEINLFSFNLLCSMRVRVRSLTTARRSESGHIYQLHWPRSTCDYNGSDLNKADADVIWWFIMSVTRPSIWRMSRRTRSISQGIPRGHFRLGFTTHVSNARWSNSQSWAALNFSFLINVNSVLSSW